MMQRVIPLFSFFISSAHLLSAQDTLSGYTEVAFKDIDGLSEKCSFKLVKKPNYQNAYFFYHFDKCYFTNSNDEPIRNYPYLKTDTLLFFSADSTLYINHEYLKPRASKATKTHIEYVLSTEGVTDSECVMFFSPMTGIASFTSMFLDKVYLVYTLKP